MKTLAELKREAKTGKLSGELIYWHGNEIPNRLKGKRKIIDANTVGVFFLNADGKKSELRVEAASLIDYDGEKLTTYRAGLREMNEEEKAVMAEWGKIEETEKYQKQLNYDLLTDCSITFWQKKRFFEEKGFQYLFGSEFSKGKKRDYNTGLIIDNKIKGEKELEYKIFQEK